MANWNNPTLTSTYTNFVTEVKDRDVEVAQWFEGASPTNLPTNAKRLNTTTGAFEKWNGSAWVGAATTYTFPAASVTGNLGIGTSSPGAKLEVSGASNAAQFWLRSTDTTSARVRAYVNGAESGVIGFLNGGGQFFETAGTERMRLDSSGNLGLGVTPSAWVGRIASQVYSVSLASPSGSPSIGEMSTNRYLAAGGTDRYIYSAPAMVYQQDSGAHKWFTAPSGTAGNAITFTQAMTLDASGNLGVGTSSPGAKLDVWGSSGDQIRVRTAATEFYRFGRNNVTGSMDFYGSQSGYQAYTFGGVDGTWMTLDASGNLGLGVTPSAWSSTQGGAIQTSGAGAIWSTGVTDVFLSQNAFFNGSYRYIGTNAASAYRQLGGAHQWFTAPSGTAGNAISFTQAMTLDASGNLGLGTTTIGYRLSVGDSGTGLGFTNAASGNFNLGLLAGTGSADAYIYQRANANLILGTNNTERARLDSSGNLIANASVTGYWQIPNGTTAQRPTGAAGQIRFNTSLNRYEGHNGTAWSSIGGGATGGGSDDVFYENGQTVTTNYTISTNKNAMSAGPITVAVGITVTVPSGSTWVVV